MFEARLPREPNPRTHHRPWPLASKTHPKPLLQFLQSGYDVFPNQYCQCILACYFGKSAGGLQQSPTMEEDERLEGEGDLIKLIDFRKERRQTVGFWNRTSRQDIPLIARS